MNYSDALHWLYARLPLYQNQGRSALKKGLDHIRLLLAHLQDPQDEFQSIHIAGTNGKGSVSHMLASVLQEQGFRTGLYTSPHLLDFRERIRLNGLMLPEEEVVAFVSEHGDFIASEAFSFFEVSVAMAFYFFARRGLQYAVVETGLGGRLDSTNVLLPILSVITNVSLDHTEVLGDSIPLIAAEKAGIIKAHTPVVIGERSERTQAVFEGRAKALQAPLYHAESLVDSTAFTTDLKGAYQRKNLRTALAALTVLRRCGLRISEAALTAGFNNVVKNTGLRGRWEQLGEKPLCIADTAHNEAGLSEVATQLGQLERATCHLVLGFVLGKPIESMLRCFPQEARYYFSKPDIPRGMPISAVRPVAARLGLQARYFESVYEALGAAQSAAREDDLIYIGGSSFVVAEALK